MKSLKWMVRRSGVWLALVLWLSAVCTGASAETPVPEEVPMASGVVEMEEDFSETIMSADLPEDLAEGYIARMMPSRRRILRAPKAIGENLTGANQNLYQLMMADILAIAAGTRTSTELSYSFEDIYPNLTLSAQDLGLDYLCNEDTPNPAMEQAVLTWRGANMQINDVLRALLADCPYDLYWYDKTGGSRLSYSYDYSYDENAVTLTGTYYVKLKVSQNYALRTDNGDGTYTISDFAVDPVYGQSVQAAAQNAQSIVRQYENLDNYNRLLAYKNRIHALTSYNYSAAGNSGLPYGDPWQLIWVFDGNPDTKVVCEGYSKAFKYLNDLSTGSAEVICATGTIDDGGHMWNIVRMEDGRNYMADITNTDSGTVGSPDRLFLVGTQNGSVSAGYSFTVGSVNLSYVYNNTHGFSTEDLTLAPNNYLFYHPGTRVLSLTSNTPSATTLQDVTITGTALTAEHVELHIYAEEGAPEYETVTAQGDTISVVRNWCHSSEPYFELVASYGDGETLVTSLDLNVTAANTFEPLQFHRIPEFLFGTNTALNASFDPLTGAEIYEVSISYENEEHVQQEILYRTFRGDDPDADYSLNLSRSQMPVNGMYRIVVTTAGTDYEQATTQVSFEVTDATVDGDVAILLDRTSMMTGDMLHWWVCVVGDETISVDVWTENGEHLSPVASNEDLVSEYYYWGRHRMEDVSGTVSFCVTAQMENGSTVVSDVAALQVTSLGTIADPQLITGLWYEGNDFSLTVQPHEDAETYTLTMLQNGEVLYDWSDESTEELQGTQIFQIPVSDLTPGECVTVNIRQNAEGWVSDHTVVDIWPIDASAVLELPDGLTVLEEEAYYGAEGIRHVKLPGGIIYIGEDAFTNSGLQTIEIPATVTGFEGDVFGKTALTVYGYVGSEAEDYAKDRGVSFVRIQ